MSTNRIPFYSRGFQLPNKIRPAVSSMMEKTVGRVDFERPAKGLASIASWIRFSRWCRMHPVTEENGSEKTKDRGWLYDAVIRSEGLDCEPIQYMEFGVYQGTSMRWWTNKIGHKGSRFIGFDTFTGLPEHWRATEPMGAFDAGGKLPDIEDERCQFEVGLFQDTLPAFLKRTDFRGRLVINLDADLYSSTLFVLTTLAARLKHGDILFFDEFSNPMDEFRAFEEFTRSFRVRYEVLGALHGHTYLAIKIV